jgi:lysophospholipase L1-like esterase
MIRPIIKGIISPVVYGMTGKSASRSWTPLTSVVEDAAPTHVVINFPSAKTVSASDFTITGITATVLSGSWSGSVYTLILDVAVVCGDIFNVNFRGKSYQVTNNVNPLAPTVLTAVVNSESQINLSWSNNGLTNFEGNKIYYSTDQGLNYTLLHTINSIETAYTVPDLSAGTLYYFKITAFSGTHESLYSNIAWEFTLGDNNGHVDWSYFNNVYYNKADYKIIDEDTSVETINACSGDTFEDGDYIYIIFSGTSANENKCYVCFTPNKGLKARVPIVVTPGGAYLSAYAGYCKWSAYSGQAETTSIATNVAGRIFRMRRSGTTLIFEYSDNGGTTFTNINTATGYTTDPVYAVFYSNGAGDAGTRNVVIKRNQKNVVKRQIIGQVYDSLFTNQANSYTDDWQNNGLTASYNTTTKLIAITNGTNDFTKYVNLQFITVPEKWKIICECNSAIGASNYGFYVGISAYLGNPNYSYFIKVSLVNDATLGKISVFYTGSIRNTSADGLVINSNNVLRLTCERAEDHFYVTLLNVTTGLSNVFDWIHDFSWAGVDFTVHKGGKIVFGSLQTANINLTSFTMINNQFINIHLLGLGDSITAGYWANALNTRFINSITTKRVSVLASAGDTSAKILARLNEVEAVAPDYVLLLVGSNHETDENYSANITAIINRLHEYGITNIKLISILPREDEDVRSRNTVLNTVASSFGLTVANCYTGMVVDTYSLNPIYKTPSLDNVHPNTAGHQYVADIIKATFPELI